MSIHINKIKSRVSSKLKLKVIHVPTTPRDIVIPIDTDQAFIYRIEVVGNKAYIFYDDRKYR